MRTMKTLTERTFDLFEDFCCWKAPYILQRIIVIIIIVKFNDDVLPNGSTIVTKSILTCVDVGTVKD